jgi:uncharacterized protein (DUF1778 family)
MSSGMHVWGDEAMTRVERRTARLNMRLTPDALELLREAARQQNQDITTFVLSAALERTRDVLNRSDEPQSMHTTA